MKEKMKRTMKPERSESLKNVVIPDNWTVHPPYITQELEFSSFPRAMKFGTFVHEAAEKWNAKIEVSAHDNVLTIKISPSGGGALTETTYRFARGIDDTFQLFQPIPPQERS